MYTHLVTSGCSFTETVTFMDTPYDSLPRSHDNSKVMSELQPLIDVKSGCNYCGSWVPFLALELGIPLKSVSNYAMGSQGNQMIARNIVHGVEELLGKGVPTKDILVGVAWSGISRGSTYSSSVDHSYFVEDANKAGWMHNPVQFFKESRPDVGWKIFNHHWALPTNEETSKPLHKDSRSYYSVFNETSTFAIESAERIHWVQEYLKGKGIDFFFTNMSKRASIFGAEVEKISDNHVKKTLDLIDRANYCEYLGIAEWQADFLNEYEHPTTYSSYMYVQHQILPYLAKKYPTHT